MNTTDDFEKILDVLTEDDYELMEEPNGMAWNMSLIAIGALIIWWMT